MDCEPVVTMRFLPGTISISSGGDVPILRKVHQAGHLTTRQLYRALMPEFEKNQWDSFNRRTRVLSNHGFLVRQTVRGLDSHVLSLGEDGEEHLRARSRTLAEAVSRRTRNGQRGQVRHDVELFDLYLTLLRAKAVTAWQSETEIRADNDFTTHGYVKDYDAVVTFHCGGRTAKVALEYERTPKTSREYGRIVAAVNRETRIHAVIYLVCNLHMESFLTHALRNATQPMYIARADAFASEPEHAPLIDVRSRRQCHLADCF